MRGVSPFFAHRSHRDVEWPVSLDLTKAALARVLHDSDVGDSTRLQDSSNIVLIGLAGSLNDVT